MIGRREILLGLGVAVLGVAGGPGCHRREQPTGAIVVRVAAGATLDLDPLRWQGPVRAVTRRGIHGVVLEASAGNQFVLSHPEACPLTVEVPAVGTSREVALEPALAAGDQLQVGFGAEFVLEARHRCVEGGSYQWKQIHGPTLDGLVSSPDGHTLRGRTHTLAQLHPAPLPWGIVALSPTTCGDYGFELTWKGPDGASQVSIVRVTAAARASGVPSVAVHHRIVLGGAGWHVIERPPGAQSELLATAAGTELIPDQVGGWKLADQAERQLFLRVGRYDQTPLDCGRAECHPTATGDARVTPMTRILATSLAGGFGEYDPACALACHTVGEPGIDDGGFAAVQTAMGVALPRKVTAGVWAELPRELRRIGGVGCTGCHGPAAIPLPGVAKTILRSDVCAVCHDAPPRYGQVVAWRTSRMAVADREPRTRTGRCAACHTTQGFLSWQDVEFLDWQKQKTAVDDDVYIPTGIACAACHDPHGGPTASRLVRVIQVPPLAPAPAWAATGSGVCVPCHAPEPGVALPAASAAALLVGQGGLRIASGEPLVGANQHVDVAGCLGCHRGGPADLEVERGVGHAFAVDRASCQAGECHRDGGSDGTAAVAEISSRAAALRARLIAQGVVFADPWPHAGDPPAPTDPALARASRNLALVLEDPAAAYHNAGYARALLDEIESWLNTRAR